jgi:hypothetical protein
MKKILLLLVIGITGSSLYAQTSDRYLKAMENLVTGVDTIRSIEGLTDMAGAFHRIAEAEKTQWLPFYYAALSQVNIGYMTTGGQMGGSTDKIDPIADKAEELVNKAEALSKDNSEIYVVRKMIATLRMMADPMNRYMTYGPAAAEALETAKKLNPENPRVYLQEALDKFYTPEQFGGNKTEAKELFETTVKKLDAEKPASPIDPTWGRSTANYFLSQIK